MSESETPSPCPCCGSAVIAVADDASKNYVIKCPNWKCELTMRDMNRGRLIEAWNMRTPGHVWNDASIRPSAMRDVIIRTDNGTICIGYFNPLTGWATYGKGSALKWTEIPE